MIVEVLHQNCPHDCVHCFLHPTPRSTEEQAAEIAREAAAAGHRVMMIPAAGEQMDGIRLLREFGAPGGVVPLKDRLPAEAARIPGASCYEFSLHGHTEDLHRLLVGEAGNFEKTVETIKAAVSAGLPGVFVNHVLHRGNYRHVESFYEFARGLGLSNVVFLKMNASSQAKCRIPELLLATSDLEDLIRRLRRLRHRAARGPQITLSAESFGILLSRSQYLRIRARLLVQRSFQGRMCVCGDEKVTVHAGTGDVYPCRYFVSDPAFRIGRWDSNRGLVLDRNDWCRDRLQKIGEPCRSCSIFRWCGGGCRAAVVAEHYHRTGENDPYAGHEDCPVANRFWI